MSEPPIPSPNVSDCPRCGAAVPEGQSYCPNCGAALHAPARSGLSVFQIFSVLCLVVLCLLAGAVGSCAAIFTPMWFSGGGGDVSGGFIVLFIAIAGLGGAAACIYGIIKIVRR